MASLEETSLAENLAEMVRFFIYFRGLPGSPSSVAICPELSRDLAETKSIPPHCLVSPCPGSFMPGGVTGGLIAGRLPGLVQRTQPVSQTDLGPHVGFAI